MKARVVQLASSYVNEMYSFQCLSPMQCIIAAAPVSCTVACPVSE